MKYMTTSATVIIMAILLGAFCGTASGGTYIYRDEDGKVVRYLPKEDPDRDTITQYPGTPVETREAPTDEDLAKMWRKKK